MAFDRTDVLKVPIDPSPVHVGQKQHCPEREHLECNESPVVGIQQLCRVADEAPALDEAGHGADMAHDGDAGYTMASGGHYDALVVDRMMPRRDGLSVISQLRKEGDKTPVLVLSALGEVDDRVTGLRAGGDDYLTKPYAFSELLARGEAHDEVLRARTIAVTEVQLRYYLDERVDVLSLDGRTSADILTYTNPTTGVPDFPAYFEAVQPDYVS